MDDNGIPSTVCPDETCLEAFSGGDVDERRAEEILLHLESCPRCQTAVEAYSREERLIGPAVRLQRQVAELVSEPAFREVEPRLRSFGVSKSESQATGGAGSFPCASGFDPERLLLGRYRLLEPIASGGMGTVFKAMHAELNKIVAIKLLTPRRAGSPAAADRFRREMQVLGRFSHPHVVMATDGGEDDGHLYLVMEYIQGIDLSTLVRRLGPLDVADACELIRQAALGVEAIHQHGLVHRDIKPSNIMLTTDGVVKVLDLGLSRFLVPKLELGNESDELTDAGQLLGTKRYMAPEQLQSSRVDQRADLYSLGATLVTLLGGDPPAAAQDAVPPELAAIVDRLIAEDPAARFPSAGELIAALKPLCGRSNLKELAVRASDAVEASHVEDPIAFQAADRETQRTGHWRFRSPVAWSLLAIAAVTLTVALAMWGRIFDSPRKAEQRVESTDNTGPPDQSKPPLDRQTQRAVAEWVIARGGRVKLHGRQDEFGKGMELPRGKVLVQSVDFYDVQSIRDQDLEPLTQLPHLHLLNLSRTSVTDRAAETLGRMRSLHWIMLNHTGVSDGTLRGLASLPDVEFLSVKHTRISDAGMQAIAALPKLTYLDASETAITDEGLTRLATLPAIRSLLLATTAVTGSGLRTFRNLSNLKTLDLSKTRISDDQLPILKSAVNLKTLTLRETAISQAGFLKLERALPKCRIVR